MRQDTSLAPWVSSLCILGLDRVERNVTHGRELGDRPREVRVLFDLPGEDPDDIAEDPDGQS